jgi:hypothetical protein
MGNIAHKGDVGLTIRLTIDDDGTVRNISSQSALVMYLTKPNHGDVLTKTGVVVGSGAGGQFDYVTVAGDLDTPGEWTAQGHVTEGSSPIFWTTEATFVVRDTVT